MTAPTAPPSSPPVTLAGYEAATAQLRSQVLFYAAAVWANASLTDATIDLLVTTFAPVAEAAQLSMAQLTSVFLAARTGTAPSPVVPAVLAPRGVPPEVVYARPVVTARTAVSEGKSFSEAMDAGYRRLESIAATDVQLARTIQANQSLADAGVTFYRRIPQGPQSCALCLIASTQRYRVKDLAPIHPGCQCKIDALDGDFEDDPVIDELLLEATHAKVKEFAGIADRGGRAVDYRKLLITHEHGELGPVLGWVDQKFTGPEGLPKAAKQSVFDAVDLDGPRRRNSERGPNAPAFLGGDTSSREEVNRRLADLLADLDV